MNVLIVDDNATNRKSLQARLRDRAFTSSEAVDGHEGLAVLKSGTWPVHGIISDILMPRMDGYRFCFEVRRLPRFREVPFIFYSSTHTSPSDEKLGLQLGANAFLHNPGDAEDLIRVLDELKAPTPRQAVSRMELPQELTLMKEYSEQLVLKLEEKNVELSRRTEQLQKLSRRLLDVQESERRHLARELHDEIGQVLTVLKLNLEAIGPASRPEESDEKVSSCIRFVDQVLQQVRGMSLDLRPSILDDLGSGCGWCWKFRRWSAAMIRGWRQPVSGWPRKP
jgi:CheY-like chemotaxis protein